MALIEINTLTGKCYTEMREEGSMGMKSQLRERSYSVILSSRVTANHCHLLCTSKSQRKEKLKDFVINKYIVKIKSIYSNLNIAQAFHKRNMM